ncbi:unnamed protein product [Albugo candida]|uniref:Uncharacterized protein n=1 Tax=Albugo candida TaxID=65357 RepID=A0A024GQ08_9STRA|nr:unnamed protein product [Albugo candida]|eukprot:CCI48651.1 unnamed protein product [Albugo candida]
MFIDLNLLEGSCIGLTELKRLGYGCVAVNVECDLTSGPKQASAVQLFETNHQKKSGKKRKYGKEPHFGNINALEVNRDDKQRSSSIRQLKRITLNVEDMNAAQLINSSAVLKLYDLVAAKASNPKVFQYLCEHANIDIITFDVSNRLPFQLKRPWIKAATKRSVLFEIIYTPLLLDSTGRRNFFSNTNAIIGLTNGKNIILASRGTRELLLRAPYDLINLGILLGLTYGKASDAISNNALMAIKHAEERRGNVQIVAQL